MEVYLQISSDFFFVFFFYFILYVTCFTLLVFFDSSYVTGILSSYTLYIACSQNAIWRRPNYFWFKGILNFWLRSFLKIVGLGSSHHDCLPFSVAFAGGNKSVFCLVKS